VRVGPLLNEVLSAHDYPAPIARILSEALTLTALLGAMLKDAGGQLTLQAQTESGIIDLLVCDYRGGELRGYVRFERERLAQMQGLPTLQNLFGKGYLAITFDQAVSNERYQGIVPLEGSSLAAAAESYFSSPSRSRASSGSRWTIPAMLPAGSSSSICRRARRGRDRIHTRLDHPEWEHVRILAQTLKANELTDQNLPLDELLWRLFHEEEEIRVLPSISLSKGCRCNFEHIRGVISRFGPEERQEMVDADGFISVDCEFCSRLFPISLSDLDASGEG
jgi:molecular chaperone Hsp33